MAEVKTSSAAEKISQALGLVRAKADYSAFPDDKGQKASYEVDGKKVTGADAKNLFYTRRYSVIGSRIKKDFSGDTEKHDAAIKELKSFFAMSGEEQAKNAKSTLDAVMRIYTKGSGGSRKLAKTEKATFTF